MKAFIRFTLILFTLVSCSSKHYINKADFNSAVSISVKKLRKNPSKVKEIENLNFAYNKAITIDNDRIYYLLESGEANIWDEVYNRFTILYNRQELVKTLPNQILTKINYSEEDYALKISESKKNAADYYYQTGLNLLNTNDKMDARDAYANFIRSKTYYENYKDVNLLINKTQQIGTNNVIFQIQNKSGIALPQEFEEEALKISLKNLNKEWVNYDTQVIENRFYDYDIRLLLVNISATPDTKHTSAFVETKKVKDGYKYKLDRNGNVAKDSTGNDIKIPVMKKIECKVIETRQKKQVTISAKLNYINTITNELLMTENINATTIFEHRSMRAYGNLDALSPKTRKELGSKTLPYPPTPVMIMDAASILKNKTKTILKRNSILLLN